MAGDHPKQEHAKHLRTIQFTMSLFSVALVAAVFLDTNTVLSRAHKQAQNVYAAMNHEWTSSFVQDYAVKHNRDSGVPDDALSSNLEWRVRRHSEWSAWKSAYIGYRWVFAAPDETSLLGGVHAGHERLERPQTLGEFIDLWDLLHKSEFRYLTTAMGTGLLKTFVAPKEVQQGHKRNDTGRLIAEFVDVEFRESESVASDGMGREDQPESVRLRYYRPPRTQAEASLGNYKLALYFGFSVFDSLRIPCTYKVLPLDAQKPLNRMLDQEWPSGRFESSFADLAEVTKDYTGIELRTVERVLFNELSRESRFNLIGVNFPAAAAAPWGVPLLLVVQIYFLIHLIRFDLSDPDQPNVPWIGLYRSRLARIVFALSSVILVPVVTIVIFASRLDGSAVGNVGLGACCLAALWFATQIGFQVPFSRPPVPDKPATCATIKHE